VNAENANCSFDDQQTTTRMASHPSGLSNGRDSFLKMLHTYYFQRADKGEYSTSAGLIRLVLSEATCFERRKRNGGSQISASVLLLRPDDYKALFIWRQNNRQWTLPGGFADGDPNIYRVATRGLKEETGIIIPRFMDPIPLEIIQTDFPGLTFGNPTCIYRLFFVAMLPMNQHPKLLKPDYYDDPLWLGPDDATRIFDAATNDLGRRFISKWRKAIPRLRMGNQPTISPSPLLVKQ
jgi:hypothetical protein